MDHLETLGCRLAICTNKPERMSAALISSLGWDGRFAANLGGDSLPVRKPDPLHLTETIARAGGGRVAFIGDSIVDVLTARAAAVPVITVRSEEHTSELQSLMRIPYAVFCLKKKKHKHNTNETRL